jgi:hypothetical protein
MVYEVRTGGKTGPREVLLMDGIGAIGFALRRAF